MSTRYGSGRDLLIGHGIPQPVPITLDAAAYAGALVYGSDGQLYRSNGTAWLLGVGPQGPQGPGGPAGPQVYETTAPNNVVPVLVMRPDAARLEDDIDVAVVPRGTGALLASVPDDTEAGGSKRGANAVDLQKVREAAEQVASGEGSVISGGANNTASSGVIEVVVDYDDIEGYPIYEYSTVGYATVSGGYNNSAANIYATVGGGQDNSANGPWAAVGGGRGNTASDSGSFIGGGTFNNVVEYGNIGGGDSNIVLRFGGAILGGLWNKVSIRGTVGGGQNNEASGTYAFIGGGINNVASGSASVVPGGGSGTVRGLYGRLSFASGGFVSGLFGSAGEAQYGLQVLRRATTNATTSGLGADGNAPGATTTPILPNKSLYAFRARVVCIQTGGTAGTAGDSKAWEVSGAIKRGANAAATALLGTPTITVLGADTALGADNATGAIIAAVASTSLGGLVINVTGQADKNLRWVATVETTEVTY
jgi:hypothetical protein